MTDVDLTSTNDRTTELTPEEAPEAVSAQPLERASVFISYRINPDQPIANALKRLIEGSIEPAPSAFVSGEGGLRPSEIGYKPQLQLAVQRAKAFVGIITPASKEREWIYYEAGAAWGRGQLYAPVLVDTSPSDLTSSIADYQAVRASNREEMRTLVAQLATCCGGVLRPHFPQRFQAFIRTLEEHRRLHDESTAPSRDNDNTPNPLGTAFKSNTTGRAGGLMKAPRGGLGGMKGATLPGFAS